jgi:hypothetical protein
MLSPGEPVIRIGLRSLLGHADHPTNFGGANTMSKQTPVSEQDAPTDPRAGVSSLAINPEAALSELRHALEPDDILRALKGIGLTSQDLAEGVDADQRTVARWLKGDNPNRSSEQAIGTLRLVVIHALQRQGLAPELIARWLRLPDPELNFRTPLATIASGNFKAVLAAYDEYVSPRPGTLQRDMGSTTGEDGERPTGEYAALRA